MKTPPTLNRRRFVQLSTLAAAGASLSARAATPATVPAASELTLPDLPYAMDALEPHIDARTMALHHDKHHAAYLKALQTALAKEPALAAQPLAKLLENLPAVKDDSLRTALRNQGGGYWNHTFFWQVMAPAAQSGKPSVKLAAAIDQAFGSMDDFKKAFGEAASKRFGSGWAWLIVSDGKLRITNSANQDNPLMKGVVAEGELGTPVLGLDVWEHAYYLLYQNRRADYISAWWNVVNWPAVSRNFEQQSGA